MADAKRCLLAHMLHSSLAHTSAVTFRIAVGARLTDFADGGIKAMTPNAQTRNQTQAPETKARSFQFTTSIA